MTTSLRSQGQAQNLYWPLWHALFDYIFIATEDNTVLPSPNQTLHEKKIPSLHSRWGRCRPPRNAKHLISLNKNDYSYPNGQFTITSYRAIVESPMCITPLPPLRIALGEESHGAILSGNNLLTWLTSAWKSTSRATILRFIDQAGFRTVAATMKRKRKFLGAELQCHQRLAHQALCSETKTSTHRQC